MGTHVLSICYLVGSVSFILGLKLLSSAATARRGNLIAAAGMKLAIVATIFLYEDKGQALRNYGWIFAGLLIGGITGVMAAKKVKMTAMPEMVSLFNGMGGGCAALIAIVEVEYLCRQQAATVSLSSVTAPLEYLPVAAALIIGSVSFAGSMIAWGKLSGRIKDLAFKGQHLLNMFILLLVLGLAVFSYYSVVQTAAYTVYAVCSLALVYGVLFVLPIGGADMPVVISLLNSFTGVAAACGGFLYNNPVMLTGGILVGAAGSLLTIMMCRAMNRSLKNVLIGAFSQTTKTAGAQQAGTYKEISISDAAVTMTYAGKVLIVPGYGLAVAQAQHACHELEQLLEAKGVAVKYAIHPVAGRMPGHMNVLLAEADVSYDLLLEMEPANHELHTTDVVLVLGANDVVNPAAKNNPASPIYGMPILEVEQARLVIVNKRSMKPGYAGIENELFFQPRTSMLFGDAKAVLQQLIGEVQQLSA